MRAISHIILFCLIFYLACQVRKQAVKEPETIHEEQSDIRHTSDSTGYTQVTVEEKKIVPRTNTIQTSNISPDEVLSFARSLMGVPYLFASTDPAKGFDCSGFITYVFNHFNIWVPRSSVDFTNQGKEVDLVYAAPGDLILFTGTDSSVRVVGHMGLVESRRNDTLFFIHSSSGKANGVVITPFQRYYEKRFVKVIRVFPDEYFE